METSAERLLLTPVEGLIGRQHLASSIATSVGVLLAFGNHRKNDVPHAHSPKWRGVTARPTAGLARGHPSRVLAFALVGLEQLERVPRERPGALCPAPRAELLHVLMPPDLDRADRIGEFYGNVKTRTFAEVLIDAAEDPYLRAVPVGMLRERRQGSPR
jgi:hypothetical protein